MEEQKKRIDYVSVGRFSPFRVGLKTPISVNLKSPISDSIKIVQSKDAMYT